LLSIYQNPLTADVSCSVSPCPQASSFRLQGRGMPPIAAVNSPVGLNPAVIASYLRAPFSRAAAGADGGASCSICLNEYMDGEMLRVMPECRHRFYLARLDAWLLRSVSCPIYRSPVSTPLSTPLSELVPPSQTLSTLPTMAGVKGLSRRSPPGGYSTRVKSADP
jgi:hypothetical protein